MPARQLFVRICDPGVYPRINALAQVRALREAKVMTPLQWGVVDWPPAGQKWCGTMVEHLVNWRRIIVTAGRGKVAVMRAVVVVWIAGHCV